MFQLEYIEISNNEMLVAIGCFKRRTKSIWAEIGIYFKTCNARTRNAVAVHLDNEKMQSQRGHPKGIKNLRGKLNFSQKILGFLV